MLKDIFCYIKMSIRGELETDGGKKKIKYPFQKIAIVIAGYFTKEQRTA